MSQRLFHRGISVTLARPLSSQQFSSPNPPPNAVIVRDLDTTFQIRKSLGKEPNTCELVIRNLAKATRELVREKPLYVRVDAGYDGQLERLFTGDMSWSESVQRRVTWETTIQLRDGDRSYRYGRVSRSYPAGRDAHTAVRDCARAMGMTARFTPAAALELRAQFGSGLALEGPAQRELTRLLAPFGMSWSIQDHILYILRADETDPRAPILISEDTGMVGTPSFGAPPEKGKAPVLKVECLLKPSIIPGGRITVVSRNIRGVFRVQSVDHTGNTRRDKFASSIEAREVKAA